MDRPKFISERGGKSLIQVRPEGSSGLIGTDDRDCLRFAMQRIEERNLAQCSDQFGKLTSLTSEVAESPVPTWKYSFGLQTQCWFGRSMGGPWALDQDASGSRWAMP